MGLRRIVAGENTLFCERGPVHYWISEKKEVTKRHIENVQSLADGSEATGEHIKEVYSVVEGVKESLEQIIQ